MRRDTQCRALRVGLAAFDTVQDIASDCREEAGLTTPGLCAGIGVDRAEYRVKGGVCAGRNGKFQSPINQKIGRAGRLGKQDRILIAHGDDRRTERNMPGMLAGSGEERKWRGQIVIEMPLIGPAGLVAQLFGNLEQFDTLTQPLRRPGIVAEGYTGIEAEPLFGAEGRRRSIYGCSDGHAIFSLS